MTKKHNSTHGVMAAELTPEEFAREGVDLEREVQAISDQLRKELAAGVKEVQRG